MPIPLEHRTLKTVADLRKALQDLDPTLELQTQNPPYTGIRLVVNGHRLEIKSPRNATAQ